jgi:hypothetical protein
MVANHPSWFEDITKLVQDTVTNTNGLDKDDQADGLLPDIDDDNDALLSLFNKHKSKTILNNSSTGLQLVINSDSASSTGVLRQDNSTKTDTEDIAANNGIEDVLHNVTDEKQFY